VSEARAHLDADAVAAAAAAARGTSVDELVNQLLLDHAASPNAVDDGGTPAVHGAP
jgi:hypothetical protein